MRIKKPKLAATLIDYTGAGAADPSRHAANVLVFTKQTRLEMRPQLMDEIRDWTWEEIMEQLEYMANTIPSSWEFVEYKFLITDVTRAFTHQFVRSRTGSYAQQTMRVLNVDGWTYGTGPTIEEDYERRELYEGAMFGIAEIYNELIGMGVKIEDARGVLPTNIHTNICAKFDLRALASIARARASSRTQGEYREVLAAMLDAVMEVHPWASLFFNRTFDVAAAELESSIIELFEEMEATPASLVTRISQEERKNGMIKLIDQMRATAG